MVERNFRLKSLLIHLMLIFLLCIVMIPLLWMLLNSLKTNNEMFKNSLALPNVWKFNTIPMPGRRGCTRYFLNMSSSQLFRHGDCIVGALSAYGLSRINFRLKNLFFFLILAV